MKTTGPVPFVFFPFKFEMIFPAILPRMKQQCEGRCFGVSPRDVARLRKIAVDAGQGKIIWRVCAAVLFRGNVFDLKGGER